MAVHNLKASTSDNEITSVGTTYAAARAGTGSVNLASAAADDTFQGAGQDKVTSTFWEVQEYFASYDTSDVPSSGAEVVSAHLTLANPQASGSWLLVAREADFGAAVDTADFVAGADLNAHTFLASAQMTPVLPSPRIAAGYTGLADRLATAGPVRVCWHSDNTRRNIAPAGDESGAWSTADDTGDEPELVVTTIPTASLVRHGAAVTQLSTGDTVYVTSTSTAVAIHLVSGGTDTTIGTATIGTGDGDYADVPALQSLALVRDASDNLYLIGPRGSAPDTALLARAYVKGTGSTWTAATALPLSMPSYVHGRINNVVAAWHPTVVDGSLMVIVSHNAGEGKTGQVAFAVVKCSPLLAGSGSPLFQSGTDPAWLPISAQTGPAPYTNETGTALDIAALPDGNTGVVYTIDDPDKTIAGVYKLTSAGGTAGSVDTTATATFGTDSVTIAHDADSKVRVIGIDSSRVAFVAAGTVTVRSWAGVILGQADLTAQSLDTFPTAATLRSTSTWDAVYDPGAGKIWHYYVDATDDTKVKRTGFSLATYQGSGEETAVTTYTASVKGLAAPRVVSDERAVVLRLSGDGEDTVTDDLNTAPNPPVLATKAAFDATKSTVFSWTFSDPNRVDSQSAYELVINAASGASAYDSGKVTSTTSNHTLPASSIANDKSWQWKARTWDADGLAGSYSSLSPFVTTSAGMVTITSPAADNATLKAASVTVTWTLTGATQAQYRMKVVNTATGATFSDTGFITSTDTSKTVTGLASGTEYRVEVTTKGAGGVASATGTRLVTPSYTSPEAPVITAVDSGSGYILVTVTNPTPVGDEPDVSHNDVYRKAFGEADYTRIGTVEKGGSYRDYAAASGKSYSYKAIGVV